MKFTTILASFIVLLLAKTYLSLKEQRYDSAQKRLLQDIPEDATLLVPQLIQKYGYPCETHPVITSDGYILNIHRIPHGRNDNFVINRPVVFLQHGILMSSADWLVAGPGKSLAYILADAGYDVWLGNTRGNRYSRSHVTLNPNSEDYWDFSWHEMGTRDAPAMIDYILARTRQSNLYFIGHSQGTTVFYVMCSEIPAYNSKVKLHISLATTAYMNNITSPVMQFLSLFAFALDILSQLIGLYEILPTSKWMTIIGEILCSDQSVTQVVCINILFAICGFNAKQVNPSLLPVILGHTPSGASVKDIVHYAQLIRSGKFRQYDEGYFGNRETYLSLSPPDYVVERITTPIIMYYSRNDWMSSEIDVDRLIRRLPNVKGKILIEDLKFNHLDYLYAIEAPELVYDLILSALNRFP